MVRFFVFMITLGLAPMVSVAAAPDPKPTPATGTEPIKVIFLGDSITAGYGVEKEQAFPHLLAEKLAKKDLPIEAVNAGISGSTSASGPSRLKWLLRSKPDILMLELGANDALRGQKLAMTKTNLKKTIKMALDQDVWVVLIGMKIPTNYGEEYRKQFATLYNELASEEDVYFVPFIEKFLADKNLVQSDAIHPNAQGHQTIAAELEPYLRPLIKKAYQAKKVRRTKSPAPPVASEKPVSKPTK